MKRLFLLCLVAMTACGRNNGPAGPSPARVAPDSFQVTFNTTKGDFVVRAHRDWSPLATDRFYELVRARTYDGIRVFRMVPGFVAQFGLTGDSARDAHWTSQPVPDEPVMRPNQRGRMSFARGGPQTRRLQVFINLGDNSAQLDNMVAGGIRGYPPFAEVVEGMDVVNRFESKHGERPTGKQGEISRYGWEWLDAEFPGLETIHRARVTREWR